MNEQMTLAGYQPSEKDMVDFAIAQPLADKIERSIGLLRMEPARLRKVLMKHHALCVMIRQVMLQTIVRPESETTALTVENKEKK